MKKLATFTITILLILSFAIAFGELSYLAQFSKNLSPVALEAASKAKMPDGIQAEALTQLERELFELGYAMGYDDMRNISLQPEAQIYVLNTKSMKFHDPSCSGVKNMKEENKLEITCTRDELIEQGYEPCGTCKP